MAAVSVPPCSSMSASSPPCANLPVLLVDDDETFRTALSNLLRDDGHAVDAYCRIAELPPLPELSAFVLITDYQLGGRENGLTLAYRFNAAHPSARIIIVTAYASHHLEQTAAGIPYISLLHKPVQYEELHRLVHKRV